MTARALVVDGTNVPDSRHLALALREAGYHVDFHCSFEFHPTSAGARANLAGSMADAGLRVVALDLDLRHPNLHTWLGGHNELGMSDVLLERADLNDALQFIPVGTADRGLYLLPTGSPVNDPTELLGTAKTLRLRRFGREAAKSCQLLGPCRHSLLDVVVEGCVVAHFCLQSAARR